MVAHTALLEISCRGLMFLLHVVPLLYRLSDETSNIFATATVTYCD